MKKKKFDIREHLPKELFSKKCEHCGCPDGFHKADCLFILRLP